jgi:transcriptional regulator with XRE-family HTH domain
VLGQSPNAASRLSTLRKRRLLSQRALAERAQIALSTLYLLEAGKTKPTFKVMSAICKALAVEPTEVEEFLAALE